ncbi:DMT family transporter [Palleronia rufa]|uniref:DMT family transporter n=1 Tax=Palleronia rufa TaxID=1530186 RepID=UPI00055F61E7|nr:SMR family transporter [Palleronia rufa]
MAAEWIFLALAATLNMAANVVLRYTGESQAAGVAVFGSVLFLVAVGLFGMNLLAYMQALKKIPLSVAYPMLVGFSTFGLALASSVIFDERVTAERFVGYLLLVAALYFISR